MVLHLVVWGTALAGRHLTWGSLLTRWDSEHYTAIAAHGYSGALWAFFPLYPESVRGLAAIVPAPVPWIGAVFSTVLFAAFLAIAWRFAGTAAASDELTPTGLWAWAILLLTPASYVFHSNHTESLFLLLSLGSFLLAARGRPLLAGLGAGLCILTRNQGFFVAAATVLLCFEREAPERRIRASLQAALAAALGAIGLFAFEWVGAGAPLAFARAQGHWRHATSLGMALRSLYLGNPWQALNPVHVLRWPVFWLLLIGSVFLWRRSRALGLYGLLSVLVVMAQGDMGNILRFGAVLFPVHFELGRRSARWPRILQAITLAVLVAVNVYVTRRFALGYWAY